MYSQSPRPKWWQLYLTFPILIALFAVDSRLNISVRGHQAVQTVIVLVVFGLIRRWIRTNATELSRMDQEECKGQITIIQIPLYQPADRAPANDAVLELVPETKGILSDTFEMDYIDPRILPWDGIPQRSETETR
jgi:hypothetical protein